MGKYITEKQIDTEHHLNKMIIVFLQINRERDDGVMGIVEIQGSKEGQQKAKQAIEDLTASRGHHSSC